jgi:hypothetical protein
MEASMPKITAGNDLDAVMPRQGWGDVSSRLRDLAITTYDVDPVVLQSLLPGDFTPEVFTLGDGRSRALVSAVTFLNTDFFVRFAPFVRLRCQQTNYRAYVRYRGHSVAWFFGTTLGSFWNFIPRYIWGLPWHRSRNDLQAEWTDEGCSSYRWQAKSKKGTELLEAVGTGEGQGILDGFSDEKTCWELLTNPADGYLRLRGKRVGHYSVWHPPFRMERARVAKARFTFWENLGLIAQEQEPHSVLLEAAIHYLISLPPKRVLLG